MSDKLPSLPDLNRLAPFVEGLGKAILREMIEDLSAIEADRVSRDVPACRVADRGFRWNGDRQEHVPQLVIEFDAVPFDGPADAKGWTDRDRFADMLAASPQPQPVQPSQFGSPELQSLILEKLAQPVQAQPSEAATLAIEALEAAKNGLEWYRTEYPEQVNGCDDEMDQQIEAAIAALQGKPAEQAQKEE